MNSVVRGTTSSSFGAQTTAANDSIDIGNASTSGVPSITLTGSSLGLDTGFPVIASAAASILPTGSIAVTGVPSYTLFTAATNTRTALLALPVLGFVLRVIDGVTTDELLLVQTGSASGPLDKFVISSIFSL